MCMCVCTLQKREKGKQKERIGLVTDEPAFALYAVCIEILKEVMAAQDAKHFLSPVDPESDGLPDYLTYIDTPMDLGTILEKATGRGGHYTTPHDIYCDVITVWRNCLIYFTETSPRYVTLSYQDA